MRCCRAFLSKGLLHCVAAALPTLPTDLHPLTANDFECASQCIKMRSPFHAGTVALLHEKRVSGSKLIPLIKMLKHALAELMAQNSNEMAKQLNGIKLSRILNETQWNRDHKRLLYIIIT